MGVAQSNFKIIKKGCISDRVFNYLQQFQNKAQKSNYVLLSRREVFWQEVFTLYKNLRVDGFLGNCNPITIAPAIIFTIIKQYPLYKNPRPTLRELNDISGVNENTIAINCKKIITYLRSIKDDTFQFPEEKIYKTIYTNIKGRYKVTSGSVSFYEIPMFDLRNDCHSCLNQFSHKILKCKKCNESIYHLKDVTYHYYKKHGIDLND